MASQSDPGQVIKTEPSLIAKTLAVNPFRAAKLQSHRFASPLPRFQSFGLESRRLTGQGLANVIMNAASVQFSTSLNISSGAESEAEISLIRPVYLIVPALLSGSSMV